VENKADVVLVGAGIMSTTLATLINQLEPSWRIVIVEKMPDVAMESSHGWNNAGTGHSALCELNYTPQQPDGSVTIDKAVVINEQFQLSRQFWSWLVENPVRRTKRPPTFCGDGIQRRPLRNRHVGALSD